MPVLFISSSKPNLLYQLFLIHNWGEPWHPVWIKRSTILLMCQRSQPMEFDWLSSWFLRITSSTSSKALSTILQFRSRADMAASVADIGTTPSKNCFAGLIYKEQVRLSSCVRAGTKDGLGYRRVANHLRDVALRGPYYRCFHDADGRCGTSHGARSDTTYLESPQITPQTPKSNLSLSLSRNPPCRQSLRLH